MSPDWYAIYTRHQHEGAVARTLISKGFEVLLPLYRSLSRWKDRSKIILRPLFSNYLFVHVGLERKLDVLRSAGVCWFVTSGGAPLPIPSADVSLIRTLVDNAERIQPHPFLQCGDQVRVNQGPFAGLTGTLLQVKNRYRVVVSIELLRKSAAVEVEIGSVQSVASGLPMSLLPTAVNCFAQSCGIRD